MSGLAGWVDFRQDLSAQRDTVAAMTHTLAHRGPDRGGIWVSQHAALGQCSSSASHAKDGKQPILNQTRGAPVVAVLAGHICNAADLRSELQSLGSVFRTDSVSEVLLESFLYWGSECVERLNGSFTLAIWDERTGRMLLGRDRLGVKPLYYYEYAGGILFASEPKGIIANPLFEAKLDIAAIPILLQPRLTMRGETPLVGLRENPPAYVLSYSRAGLSARRYWSLASEHHRDSFAKTARRVRELMEDTVRREIVADVPCGAMLSGGLDSTSVAAMAMRELRLHDPRGVLDTFCVQFDTDPAHFVGTELRPEIDAPYASEAAQFIGSRHRTVTASLAELLEVIPATRRTRDLPGWGQFDASMYLLFREMRRTCPVALTGEAADEVFGGYPYFFKPDVLEREGFPWLGNGPRLSDHLSPEVRKHVNPREAECARYSQLISEVPRLDGEDPGNARMREVFYLSMAGPLAVVLDRKDRMSMSQGLEVRIPFCDHRLVEYVWNVPWSMKSAGGVKGLLKAAVADVVPACANNRKKSAYPHMQSPDYDRILIGEATRLVEDEQSPIAWMFDVQGLKSLIAELGADVTPGGMRRSFPGGASPAYMLVHLVEISRWLKDYKVSVR